MSVTTVSSSMITDATILNADIGAAAAIATTKLGAGAVVQVVHTVSGAVIAGTGAMPSDDTIPSNSEGLAMGAFDTAITPTHASNKLLIEATIHGTNATTAGVFQVALYQDSGAAIAVGMSTPRAGDNAACVTLTFLMAAGTTSATTFKLRAGGQSGTDTINGLSSGRLFGGKMASTLTVTEIKV
jgi:hypothetical protein|tara:strand:- start:282 stop:836 length:555 start_codon:yes stop_codon:yes gene_type:complete